MITRFHSLPIWFCLLVALVPSSPSALSAQCIDCREDVTYGVSVTPDGATAATAPVNTSGHQVTFTVRNTGTGVANSFTFSCSATGGISCSGLSRSSAGLAPGFSTTVTVTFATGGTTGTGNVRLTASGSAGNVSNVGSYNVPVVRYASSVTPDGGLAPERYEGGTGYTQAFTVRNTGTASRWFSFACSGSGGVTCTSRSPTGATLAPNATRTVTATYGVGAAGTAGVTGTLTLTSTTTYTGGTHTDTGTYSVPVHRYAVATTPDGTVTSRTHRNTGGHTVTFAIRNTGTKTNTFTLTCSASSGAVCNSTNVGTVTVGRGAQATKSVGFRVGGIVGTGRVTLTASSGAGPGTANAGYFDIPIVAGAVSTTPDGAVTPYRQTGSGGHTAVFTVRNTGPIANTFVFSCSGSGGVVCTGTDKSSATLGSNTSTTVVVDYDVGPTPGTGTLILVASGDGGASNTGTFSVPISNLVAGPMVLSVEDANPGSDLARGRCVTIAAGPAAIECGDLRIVHPLPPVRTFNKSRGASLLYNSAFVIAHPTVGAHVRLPSNGLTPDSVRATLTVNDVVRAQRTWNGAAWTAGATRRIALSYQDYDLYYGVHGYTLEVTNFIGVATHAATVTGEFAMVARKWTDFGRGWWITGYEYLRDIGADYLWIGPDGSTRRYRWIATNQWESRSRTRPPDTLRIAGNRVVRRLRGGGEVRFSTTSGQHRETVDRLGRVTRFVYGTVNEKSRMVGIEVPTPAGPLLAYQFVYDSTMTYPRLDAVRTRAGNGGWRETRLTRHGDRVRAITDPDGSSVEFDIPAWNLPAAGYRDRRGTWTRFAYADGKISTVTTQMQGEGPDIVTTYTPFVTRGLTAPVDPANTYAELNGPRTDVADVTRFWMTSFLAPAKVQDALGHTTQLYYEEAAFPGLVTSVVHPNAWEQITAYDGRGRVATVTDPSTGAVTRYEWDDRWDAVTKVVPPEGDSTRFGYHPDNGNRLWQEDARGLSSRVTFAYRSDGLLESVVGPETPPARVEYDPVLGNLTASITPLGFRTERRQDAAGRDTLVISPIDAARTGTLRIVYDLMDRVDTTVTTGPAMNGMPAETLIVANAYDLSGNLTSVTRWIRPDAAPVGTLTTGYGYDRAHRRVWSTESGRKDSTVYDPAGNAVALITARGDTTTMVYDAVGRLKERIVPSVTYTRRTCIELLCGYEFPRYANLGTSLRIPADTVSFTYDPQGNMIAADNRFARITRGYTQAGRLEWDSTRIGRGDGSFPWVYGIRHAYDLNGRPVELRHPGNLAPPGAAPERYAYTGFGALDTLINILGNRHRFAYDTESRLTRRDFPGGYSVFRYDDDGRLTRRTTWLGSSLLQDAQHFYDRRNRVTAVDPIGSPAMWYDGVTQYSGMGHVVRMLGTGAPREIVDEELTPNALGSLVGSHAHFAGPRSSGDRRHEYRYTTGGRVQEKIGLTPDFPPQYWYPDTTRYSYDLSGNQIRMARWQPGFEPREAKTWTKREAASSYYSADQRLVAYQVYRDSLTDSGFQLANDGTWEEYGYDALGRRVWKRERRVDLCDQNAGADRYCSAAEDRYVWNGDQILYEIRTRVSGGIYAGTHFGTVGYTHGGAIDQPLDVIRQGYPGGTKVFVPHTNWRSLFVTASDTTGAQVGCDPTPFSGCEQIDWPGATWNAFYNTAAYPVPAEWFGSVVQGKQDQSGLMYMRNRYYDPQSGQFTQQDPIGIAGGLNVYGFAEGDPVNFSDPFGLCPAVITGRPCSLALAISVGFVPIVGDAVDIIGAALGKDLLTGESITGIGVAATVIGTLVGSGKLVREGADLTTRAIAVLGRNPDYVRLADQLNAPRFNMSEAVWESLDDAARTALNRAFLDSHMSRGADFILSNHIREARPGTWFGQEIAYLRSRGYIASDDGMRMIKPR